MGKLDSGFSSVCLYAFRRECSSGTRRSMKPSIRSESRDLYHVVDIVSAHFYTSLFNICHRPRSSALYSSEKDKGLLLPLTTCRRALLRTYIIFQILPEFHEIPAIEYQSLRLREHSMKYRQILSEFAEKAGRTWFGPELSASCFRSLLNASWLRTRMNNIE